MASLPKSPDDGRKLRIWDTVEELVLAEYDTLAAESMRGSYYILRERLDSLREAGDVTDAEFDHFTEHYDYYRDDKWPEWEAKHGLDRPTTKPPTVIIEDGTEYTEARIDEAWSRARGFIFVEKAGMASKLAPLSRHGWLIAAGQGEATRSFREKVLDDGTDRPILVLTDDDESGDSIAKTLSGDSRRTAHLNLSALATRVTRLGLTGDDADALGLPRERDPTKSSRAYRTELDAFAALGERATFPDDGDPFLAYVVAKMRALGIPVAPLPVVDPKATVRTRLTSAVLDTLRPAVEDAVDEVLAAAGDVEAALPADGSGELMALTSAQSSRQAVDLDDVHGDLVDVADDALAALEWERQTAYERQVVAEAGEEAVGAVAAALDD